MSEYLRENFYVTSSGNFRTQALIDVMMEVVADRVLYSVDYPFEDMSEAANWFDRAPIAESDRLNTACGNARRLFSAFDRAARFQGTFVDSTASFSSCERHFIRLFIHEV